MPTTLYYYSRDESSVRAAGELAATMKRARTISIQEALEKGLTPADERIGVVYPSFSWGMPSIVSAFLRRIPAGSSANVFTVALCGDTSGTSVQRIARQLRTQNLRFTSGFLLKDPAQHPYFYE